jgi:TetR/AcrR family transcriptional regulator, regulator of cefoperazone and chloramphenicol sensitivity
VASSGGGITVAHSSGTRSSATKVRLLDTAEHLFARGSIAGVTTREITEAAGQKNTSAISYHFGSREGLLLELLARRGAPVDERRRALRDTLGVAPELPELVDCLVVPYSALLLNPEGRSYLRIVAQLRGRFAQWRVASDSDTTVHLAHVLDEIERRGAGDAAVRRERVVAMIMVITATTAERARVIDEHQVPELDHDRFVENLVAMCAALVQA